MKTKIIGLLFLIATLSLSVIAKEEPKGSKDEIQAPKGTSEIVVNNNLSTDDNLKLIDDVINNNYLSLQSKVDNTLRISTKKNFKERIVTYIFTVSIKDNAITITGKYTTNYMGGPDYTESQEKSFKKISNTGTKNSIQHENFAQMQSFALLLGNNLKYIAD